MSPAPPPAPVAAGTLPRPRRRGTARVALLLVVTMVAVTTVTAGVAPAGAKPPDGSTPPITGAPVVEPRVVGGTEAPYLPHQVLVEASRDGRSLLCGGSVIHPRWVLTAAHCLDGHPDLVRIGMGSTIRSRAQARSVAVPGSAVRVHPDWDRPTFRNDVALVRLPTSVRLAPLRVADGLDAEVGAIYERPAAYHVSGWGRTVDGGALPQLLRWAVVPIIDDATCGTEAYYPLRFDAGSMVCAGFAEGGIDSCQGDSGGPLWFDGVQVGIVSWGIGCAAPSQPGVYTRLAEYAPWIESHVHRPANDDFGDATPLACPVGSIHQGTAFASGQPGEATFAGGIPDSTVWFRRVVEADGELTVSTRGSTYDTVLAAFDGDEVDDLQTIGDNDDIPGDGTYQSELTVPVTAGAEYRIGVDGWLRAQGNLQLNWHTSGVAPFLDVGAGHRFAEAIEAVADDAISTGYDDCTYRPTLPVTRGAMAAFLHRLAGWPGGDRPVPDFPDVPASFTFQGEVSWLAETGLSEGYPDGTFRPRAPVSRQATAGFLYRLAGNPPVTLPPPAERFPDVGADHAFADAIYWMVANDMASGYDDGRFRPTAPVSRQAMAAFLTSFPD